MSLKSVLALFGVFSASLLFCVKLHSDFAMPDAFVVWNIGQGQWTTLRTEKFCDHFDAGGEKRILPQVLRFCRGRTHRIHLSHWDWDHMSYLQAMQNAKVAYCLWNRPWGKSSAHKENLVLPVPFCRDEKPYQVIYSGNHSSGATTNDTSEVIRPNAISVLVPGDSPRQEEQLWAAHPALSNIKGLVLGHHGSRTSTSEELLRRLPHLQWAVASAREQKYGHPHPEVVRRLKQHHIPLLRTEDWGTLIFYF